MVYRPAAGNLNGSNLTGDAHGPHTHFHEVILGSMLPALRPDGQGQTPI